MITDGTAPSFWRRSTPGLGASGGDSCRRRSCRTGRLDNDIRWDQASIFLSLLDVIDLTNTHVSANEVMHDPCDGFRRLRRIADDLQLFLFDGNAQFLTYCWRINKSLKRRAVKILAILSRYLAGFFGEIQRLPKWFTRSTYHSAKTCRFIRSPWYDPRTFVFARMPQE